MSRIEPQEIIDFCAEMYGVSLEELRTQHGRVRAEPGNMRPVGECRAVAVYLIRRHTMATLREIAALLGQSDRTWVRVMGEKIEHLRRHGGELANRIEAIERRIDDVHEGRMNMSTQGYDLASRCTVRGLPFDRKSCDTVYREAIARNRDGAGQ
ncbi:MAG TPA: helix-turn-helix domain-containing protein [Hyphomicrobiaceae bacterium]|nr:helix-turn-helix domain-containing protein [Hyphomicrobiaceae bacterium]